MYLLFLTLILCLVVTTLSNRRNPGVLEITVASFLLYTFPLILGFVVNPHTKRLENFGDAEYLLMSIPAFCLLCLAAWQVISYKAINGDKEPLFIDRSVSLAHYILVVALWLVLLRDLADVRHLSGIISKTEMNQLTTGFGSLIFINLFATTSAAIAVFRKSYLLLFMTFLAVLIQGVVFQSRSAMAFSLIAAGLAYMVNARNVGVLKKIGLSISAVFFIFLLVIYKSIKGRVVQGLFDNIEPVTSKEFWVQVFHTFEPQKTTYLLKGVMDNNIILPAGNFWSALAELIPFSETLFSIENQKWGNIVLDQLYNGDKGYWGNNVFAEMYTYFTSWGVFVFSLCWCLVVLALGKAFEHRQLWIKVFAIAMIPLWCFFIHRLSVGALISTTVNWFIILAFIYSMGTFMVMIFQNNVKVVGDTATGRGYN